MIETNEKNEAVEQIKKRIHTSVGFKVNRMPKKKFELFMKTAKEEFSNDYGMTISFFMDYFFMLSPINERVLELENKIKTLEQQIKDKPKEEKSKGVKTLSGRIIR